MDTEITHASLLQSSVGEHTTKNESSYIQNYISIESISGKKFSALKLYSNAIIGLSGFENTIVTQTNAIEF